MIRSVKAGLAGLVFAAVGGLSAAHANPITLYYGFDGVTYNTLGTTTTGVNIVGTTVSNGAQSFIVGFNATGTGTGQTPLPQPGLDTQTITVSGLTGGTIYLVAIETGLTATNLAGFNIGYTNNFSTVNVGERFLVGQSLTPGTMSSSSVTLAPLTTASAFVPFSGLTSGYSIGERYVINFGSTFGTVNATISERGVVPEPMSLAVFGSGLVGLGLIRRRKRT